MQEAKKNGGKLELEAGSGARMLARAPAGSSTFEAHGAACGTYMCMLRYQQQMNLSSATVATQLSQWESLA